jgi:spore coat protein CotH
MTSSMAPHESGSSSTSIAPRPRHAGRGTSRRGFLALGGIGVAVTAAAAACSTSGSGTDAASTLTGDVVTGAVDGDFFDQTTLHTMTVVVDETAYDEMIAAYQASQEKNWIEADVEIDGNVFEKVGLKLKGNSSLRSLSNNGGGGGGAGGAMPSDGGGAMASDGGGAAMASDGGVDAAAGGSGGMNDEGDGDVSADDPTGLPWVIRLDKYTDDQSYSGRSFFAVRGNNTPTSLNEAVALDALALAEVPAEKYAFTSFRVNGADPQLRLVLDVPDDDGWNADAFDSIGATFKADSDGDYSYRGDTEDDYADVFDLKFTGEDVSDKDAFAALGEFLTFINDSEDDEFGSGLGDVFDVDGFATYLALQELVQNTDDIDGPGNNSYLHYDSENEIWSIIAWDQNLSFGGMGGGGGQGGGGEMPRGGGGGAMPSDGGGDRAGGMPGGGAMPSDGGGDTATDDRTTDEQGDGRMPDGGGGGGRGGMGGNILSERFLADDDFTALYQEQLENQKAALYESGDVTTKLETPERLLNDEASDLVTSDEVSEDAATITAVIEA